MKLIKQSFEILDQQCGFEGIYKQIERAGRTCYKSEDKITENSAKEFVDRMIKSGHGAMLEHGTVYLEFNVKDLYIVGEDEYLNQQKKLNNLINKYSTNKYSIVKVNQYYNTVFITTNYRVLVENDWLDDLQYICEPTEYHEKRITVKFITDQGILREFTRHRVFSFAVESTRYCNYSRSKFSNEVTFIQPNWISDEDVKNYHMDYDYFTDQDNNHIIAVNRFMSVLKNAEYFYIELIKLGWKPQQARNILPLATKCDMVMTGFVSDWKHFFRVRSRIAETGKPHPQAQELADPLMDEFVKRGIMETLL